MGKILKKPVYIFDITGSITSEQKEEAYHFAELHCSHSKDLYLIRGAKSEEQILFEILVGKEAEHVSYNFFKDAFNITKPEHRLMHKGEHFTPDLQIKNINNIIDVHIKCSQQYEPSWLFDKKHLYYIKKSERANVSLLLHLPQYSFVYRILALVDLAYNIPFKPPISQKYKELKAALYFKDLQAL
jgi:hypothetical protein